MMRDHDKDTEKERARNKSYNFIKSHFAVPHRRYGVI